MRKTPLMRVEHEGSYAAVESKGSAPRNPSGSTTCARTRGSGAGRRADLEDDAREVAGEERAAWWERAVAAYPPYAEYQLKTDRLIPVFVLEPAGA